jgi:anion-transporting  ArsA/GET3 family ATPase
VFGRILRLVEGHVPRGMRRPDVVVLDAPATGHGVQLIAAPRLVSDVIRSGPIGSMASEIAAFMHDAGRCGVVAVTVAEEIPVHETLELLSGVEDRLGRPPELVVVNGLYPPLPAQEDWPERSDLDDPDLDSDPATTLWRQRRRINERELARLESRWDGAMAELPLLPIDRGPALVGALGRQLAQALRELA